MGDSQTKTDENNVHVGKGVRLASKSGVMRDIPDGETLGGVPAVPIKQWHRSTVALAKLVRAKLLADGWCDGVSHLLTFVVF